ncbi:MAG: hypothetical protein M3442_05355 [Chloroflexota bacterium]|nr:hypothetical protein [Chloroflexota bacterium]
MTMTASATVATPARCRPIEQKIEGLLAELESWQEQLQGASTPQKPGIAAQIKKINRQIAGQRAALTRCKNGTG